MLGQTPAHGPGLSRSRNGHRDRERPAHLTAGWGRLTWPRMQVATLAEVHPGDVTYNWRGQRKSAAGSRVTVTSPRLCAVSTAWAEVKRNGVVPGVKVTTFTAHRPPR
jgi:hypothetical protein